MSWDYAELSKVAKKVGGPEALVDVLVSSGKREGHMEMVPYVFIASILGCAIYTGMTYARDFLMDRKRAYQETTDAAKRELVEGIREFDANCSGSDVDDDMEDGAVARFLKSNSHSIGSSL